MGDWQLKPWDLIYGPLLFRRGEVPAPPDRVETVRNYYRGHKTLEELEAERSTDVEKSHNSNSEPGSPDLKAEPQVTANSDNGTQAVDPDVINICGPRPEGAWYSGPVLFWLLKKALLNGVEQDIVSAQKSDSKLAGDLEKTHAHADHYDNEAEYMFSFLQILTACTASFTHGANDVAKLVFPFHTYYQLIY